MNDSDRSDRARVDAADVAIIGMAGRFPMAANVDAFWQNIRDGADCITVFSDAELADAGVAEAGDPQYVKARGCLKGVEYFDAAFFDFSPRDAEITDPQQRVMLECAWEALESAGYTSDLYSGRIGVYAGSNLSTYLIRNLCSNPCLMDALGDFHLLIANDKDYVSTRVSYKLNLKGPSITVQTACSTGLVAVHLACQGLLNGECDMALAGSVSVSVPQNRGYLYRPGGILSPDGRCRAFDASAQGTVFGDGAGVVVLKRLEDALVDGDHIEAIIKGSAINNDGGVKLGYTAPSVEGQSEVIAEALAVAQIAPESISYIEAHGTGTPLGDPIEVAALTKVFHRAGKMSCALGSVKTNLGHLDTAAGIAGLIKTVFALKHKLIPPSLHFVSPNPEIHFADGPFFVNTTAREWTAPGVRRAGVSSFGIGGTNAHVILEEAPPTSSSTVSRPWQLIVLSAKTDSALETATTNLAKHLREHPGIDLADAAYTLQAGRKSLSHRRTVVCQRTEDAVNALETRDAKKVFTAVHEGGRRSTAFLFPGQGTQYFRMGWELYQTEPVFRDHVDHCVESLRADVDLREFFVASSDQAATPRQELDRTDVAQPALFVIEYALARLWMSWGVRPQSMIGHSLGEYVAACLAGVYSVEDALAIVAVRGRLMSQIPAGVMLAVAISESAARSLLTASLSLAAVNGPSMCVISGPPGAMEEFEQQLARQKIASSRLHTSHAFHSAMMDPIIEPFRAHLKRFTLRPPKIPYVSNLTGAWITPELAFDTDYWVQHLREPVRFGDGIGEMLKDPELALLEVGPGNVLVNLARQARDPAPGRVTLSSLSPRQDPQSDLSHILQSVGKLWLAGVPINWSGVHSGEQRRRLALPTYPFERQRYWVEPGGSSVRNCEAPADLNGSQAAFHYSLHPRPQLRAEYVPPRNEFERKLAVIWQELLGIENPGVHDDFFEAGGNSLLATSVIARVREAIPVDVPLQSLFDATTIAKLAELLESLLVRKLEDLPEEEAERLLLLISQPR